MEKAVGFPLRGNGSPFFQSDRGLGLKYKLEKQRDNGNKLSSVRTIGFAYYHEINRSLAIPPEVRKWILSGQPCAMCGTTSNIVVDHKDGNKQPLENPSKDDFQPLCNHCNTVKREICKKCNETGKRFDAKILGYKISWLEGTDNYQPQSPRCRGCYWFSPHIFRNKLRYELSWIKGGE